MRSERISIGTAVSVILAVTLLVMNTWAAAREKVPHDFNNNGKDGVSPYAGLMSDASGNLYGTTNGGGAYGLGTVFELTPKAGGGWAEKILHSFGNGKDGYFPDAGLIFDTVGNLYGTTTGGGNHDWGTVFELTPEVGGGWTEKLLHNFNNTDGATPEAGLIFDAGGNLYGTTVSGGTGACIGIPPGCGTVFELTPKAGSWTEKVLHNFSDSGKDGHSPFIGSLIFDSDGNLYGTTIGGGMNGSCSGNTYMGCGTVFELSPKAGGGWTEKVLHSFNSNGKDGYNPYASVILDAAGNLYGTTYSGGDSSSCPGGCGMVFEITPWLHWDLIIQ